MDVFIFQRHGYHEDPPGVMGRPIRGADGEDELLPIFYGSVKPASSSPSQNNGQDIQGIEVRMFQGNRWESNIGLGQLSGGKLPLGPPRSDLQWFAREDRGLLRNPFEIPHQRNDLLEGLQRLHISHDGHHHVLWYVIPPVVVHELFSGDVDEDILITDDRVPDGMPLICRPHEEIPKLSRDAVFSQLEFLLDHLLLPSVLVLGQLAVPHVAHQQLESRFVVLRRRVDKVHGPIIRGMGIGGPPKGSKDPPYLLFRSCRRGPPRDDVFEEVGEPAVEVFVLVDGTRLDEDLTRDGP